MQGDAFSGIIALRYHLWNPTMQNAIQLARLTTLAALFTLITACAGFEFPWVHKYDIQQGNIISQEMIDQLKPGMTKRQVRFIMGPPLLHDTFTDDRWDYYYGHRKAGGAKIQERVTIFFDSDKMTHFTGDYHPSPPKNEQAEVEVKTTEQNVKKAEQSPE